MPRFYFHQGVGEMQRDDHGSELRDGAEAYAEALRLAGELIGGISEREPQDRLSWRMIVSNEQSCTVCEISFTAERHAPSLGRQSPVVDDDRGDTC